MPNQSPHIEQLDNLFARGTLQSFTKGEIILRTDQTPPGVFCIKEGYVKVYSITDAGEENLRIIYGPDMIFPIIWALTGKQRQTFYEAMCDSVAYRVSKESFLTYLKHYPEAQEAMLMRLVDMFNIYADRIENLEHTRSYTRVIYRLLRLAERFGEVGSVGTTIKAPIKHHDIANSINCSRETVSREMEVLERKGLISYQEHLVVIKDLPGLQKELLSS